MSGHQWSHAVTSDFHTMDAVQWIYFTLLCKHTILGSIVRCTYSFSILYRFHAYLTQGVLYAIIMLWLKSCGSILYYWKVCDGKHSYHAWITQGPFEIFLKNIRQHKKKPMPGKTVKAPSSLPCQTQSSAVSGVWAPTSSGQSSPGSSSCTLPFAMNVN